MASGSQVGVGNYEHESESHREEKAAGVGSVEELGLGGSFISSGHNLDRWMNLDE